MHYTHDNRLQRLGDYPVEMDADGNLLYVTDGETMGAYTYDARNRLVQAGKHRYRYSAQGHRIEQIVRKKSTRYVVDESQELSRVLMEVDSEGNILARYIYGLGLIGREDASGHYLSYHSDMRGSTTILTDETGRVTDRYTYGIYGELEKHEGTTHQPFCYNGRDGVMTDANGLYYMRARYYDPKLKRFLNRDIIRGDIADGQTFNRYAYVNGDPISYIDPLGLFKDCPEGTGNPKYQVGLYNDIKGAKGLDAHHVGQKAIMKRIVKDYDEDFAPAINVPKVGHTIKGPNGIVSRSTKGIDDARQLLARDIKELRRVYDDVPNSALKELISLNKKMYPEMRKAKK